MANIELGSGSAFLQGPAELTHYNCPNCGAPVDPFAGKCEYCGTSYVRRHQMLDPDSLTIEQHINITNEMLQAGILTPNEYRRLMGLRGV